MLTDNMVTMCQTLGDMTPRELDGKNDCMLLYAHDGKSGNTILIQYGTPSNVASGSIAAILRFVEQLPAELRDVYVRSIAHTLVACYQDAERTAV